MTTGIDEPVIFRVIKDFCDLAHVEDHDSSQSVLNPNLIIVGCFSYPSKEFDSVLVKSQVNEVGTLESRWSYVKERSNDNGFPISVWKCYIETCTFGTLLNSEFLVEFGPSDF